MLPSAHDLIYFVEIAATQNLSRAAERLGISQPSLTLAMQRLENSIGTPLLIRSKKGVTLTQAGRQLLAHSRELLKKWESIRADAVASMTHPQGAFVVGCHPSVALYSLPLVMTELMENYPRLELKLCHDLSRRIAESVIQLDIDLGIVVNPVKHPDLMIRKLCDDEVSFWVGEGKRKVQDFRSGEAVLICDPDLLQVQYLMKKLKNLGLHYRRILPTPSLELVRELVTQGAGVGIIPGRVAAMTSSTSGKTIKRIPKTPSYHDEICLIYRAENRGVRSIQVIGEAITRHLNRVGGG